MSISAGDSFADDAATDDDSNANSDADGYEGDYRPISAIDDSDDDGGGGGDILTVQCNGGDQIHHHANSSPNFLNHHAENGISALDLNGGGGGGEGEEQEEEEEREREASIYRAFREDESRRRAPLTRENASRVMEAMRGVSFLGLPPDWADRVPEDCWVDQLGQLRSGGEPIQHS